MQNKLAVRLAVGLLACAASIATCHAQVVADDGLKTALQARYAALKQSMAKHDRAGIASILALNFTSVDASGRTETGAEMIAEVNAVHPDPNKISTTTLLSIVPNHDSITVKQRYDMTTTRTAPGGEVHNIKLMTFSTDTWIKPEETLLLARTATNELSMYVDGHVISHKVAP